MRRLGNQSDRAANPPQRAAAQGAARAQMARIRGAQQRVLARLDSFGRSARVLYSVQTAYNGIAARIDAGILPQLRSHADVKGVYALPVHYIENSTSLPFIKAASAWTATGGNAGDGVRIAVIDTGVDYDPSLGFVSGGGQLIHNGYKASVGVNIKYLKSDKAQGSLLFIEHRPTGDVVVKSNAIGTMAIVGGEAIPTGKATLNGVGNHSFIARVIDNGEPGLTDRFGIRMTSPTGAILVDLTFDPIQLTGGNFSVPKLTGK